MYLKTILFFMLAAFTAPVIVYGQQPSYRIRQLSGKMVFNGSVFDHQKQDFTYYTNRGSAILDFDDMPVMLWDINKTVHSMNYDLVDMFYDSAKLGIKWLPNVSLHQTFDADGNIHTHGIYSIWNKKLDTDTMWYVPGNKLKTVYDRDVSKADCMEEYTYDAQGRLEKMERRFGNAAGTLDRHWHYTYNGTSVKPASYSVVEENYDGTQQPKESTYYYVYDGADNKIEEYLLTTDKWHPVDTIERAFYTYNANGDMEKEDRYFRYHGIKQNYDSVSFICTYDGNNRLHQKLHIKMNGTGLASDTMDATEYSYDAFGMPATMFIRYSATASTTYNAVYEMYWPTDVEDKQAIQTSVDLYPLPATTVLHIKARLVKAQDCKAGITDMSGKLLRSFIIPAKERTASIPLQGIPPGTYIFRLEGATEIINRKFVVQ
jgi:hypothetical protein